MSWRDFDRLLENKNPIVKDWMAAIKANPNTPADALKVAILNRVIDRKDMAALEAFCGQIIEMVERAQGLVDVCNEINQWFGTENGMNWDNGFEPEWYHQFLLELVHNEEFITPDWLEDDDENPYLLSGEELERTTQRRMAGIQW